MGYTHDKMFVTVFCKLWSVYRHNVLCSMIISGYFYCTESRANMVECVGLAVLTTFRITYLYAMSAGIRTC
jgi:hypothetical protein